MDAETNSAQPMATGLDAIAKSIAVNTKMAPEWMTADVIALLLFACILGVIIFQLVLAKRGVSQKAAEHIKTAMVLTTLLMLNNVVLPAYGEYKQYEPDGTPFTAAASLVKFTVDSAIGAVDGVKNIVSPP